MQKSFLCILLIALVTGCQTPRYMYAPTRVNAPLLTQKQELQLNGSIAALKGFDASVAYAVSPGIGLMINGSWRNHVQKKPGTRDELLNPFSIHYHRASVDLGIGWFKKLESSSWYIEIFAGGGSGILSMEDEGVLRRTDTTTITYSRSYKNRLARLFFQPELGANPSEFFQIVFFVRFQFIKFDHIQTNYSYWEMQSYGIPESPSAFVRFAEPGFSIRFYPRSLPHLGFESNFLLSRMYNSDIYNIPVHFSVGVHARFPGKKNK